MIKLGGRVVETPMASNLNSICDDCFWVCDRDVSCREVRGLWEAKEFLRERERGFDNPYASQIHTTQDVDRSH